MTDPVNTDALRAWADDARDIANRGGNGPNMLLLCASNLTAAADEIDRLRADVKASATMHEQARVLADSALKQRDALRAVIEDAPHDKSCLRAWEAGRVMDVDCTCWKAGVL